MAIQLRVLLVVVSVLLCIFVARKLKKSQILVMDAFFWLLFSAMVLLLGLFPSIVYFLSDVFGIMSPVNLVFLVIIFLLILRCFLLSIRVSALEDKLRGLVEEIAIINKDRDENSNE